MAIKLYMAYNLVDEFVILSTDLILLSTKKIILSF